MYVLVVSNDYLGLGIKKCKLERYDIVSIDWDAWIWDDGGLKVTDNGEI